MQFSLKTKILYFFGYMTEELAIANGFTNVGLYGWIPIYFNQSNLEISCKWWPFELALSILIWMEDNFTDAEEFSFLVGYSLIQQESPDFSEDDMLYVIIQHLQSKRQKDGDIHDIAAKALCTYMMQLGGEKK